MSVTTEPERKKPGELTISKVLAGAGAAATTAVLGSFFGADGTVYGAAFGSVASTVATTVYQRSIDRTRQTLVARVRVRRPGSPEDGSEVATVRLPRPPVGSAPPDVQPDVPARGRPRWLLWAGVTALVFVISMVVVTGIELAKGSTLTGNDSGTSIGRVVAPPAKDPAPAEESGSADTSATETASPTAESSATATPDPDVPSTGQGRVQQQPPVVGDDQGGSSNTAPSTQKAPASSVPATPNTGG